MDREVLIEAHGLSKIYRPPEKPAASIGGLLRGMPPGGGHAALKDVSLRLSRGEALGIIGRNGAGKSTLLQILCGTLAPTAGTVERRGRIAAMLELGAGFNPEFTGRENAMLNASLLGLGDRAIAECFASIQSFAELGEFIDRPVGEYSSGMVARLAFAVCAHVDADVLVVDEVLNVGDLAFQAKCNRFIEDFLKRGALLFVSHDELAVLSVCDRGLWLDGGEVKAEGPAVGVLQRYRAGMNPEPPANGNGRSTSHPGSQAEEPAVQDSRLGLNPIEVSSFLTEAPSHGHGGAVIDDVYFAPAGAGRSRRIGGGALVELHIEGEAKVAIPRPIIGFILRDATGQNLFGDNSFMTYGESPPALAAGKRFHCVLEFRMPFLPVGSYTIAPSVIEGTQQSHVQLVWIEEAVVLTVHQSPVALGKVGVPMQVDARIVPARRAASA